MRIDALTDGPTTADGLNRLIQHRAEVINLSFAGGDGDALQAEFIRELIVCDTREGLAAARARGRVGDRPSVITPEIIGAARDMLPTPNAVGDLPRTLDRPTAFAVIVGAGYIGREMWMNEA